MPDAASTLSYRRIPSKPTRRSPRRSLAARLHPGFSVATLSLAALCFAALLALRLNLMSDDTFPPLFFGSIATLGLALLTVPFGVVRSWQDRNLFFVESSRFFIDWLVFGVAVVITAADVFATARLLRGW